MDESNHSDNKLWERVIPVVVFNKDNKTNIVYVDANGVGESVEVIPEFFSLPMQTPEQFYLTAANVHLELAKEFYVLSQGESNTVVKGDNVFPKVTIVDDSNVETVRTQWAKQMEVGFIIDET